MNYTKNGVSTYKTKEWPTLYKQLIIATCRFIDDPGESWQYTGSLSMASSTETSFFTMATDGGRTPLDELVLCGWVEQLEWICWFCYDINYKPSVLCLNVFLSPLPNHSLTGHFLTRYLLLKVCFYRNLFLR